MSEEQGRKNLEAMQTMVALAKERTEMAKERTKMSAERSKMSAHRSEMSAQRTYMNTERTLSVWIRTALAAMIFGIAIDRFGLLFGDVGQSTVNFFLVQAAPSTITGVILVIFSMFMAVSAALRFVGFARHFKKENPFPEHHKPMLPVVYAFMIVVFGGVLLALMLGIV